LQEIIDFIQAEELLEFVDVKASFCFERCDRGPTVTVGDSIIEKADKEKIFKVLQAELEKKSLIRS